VPRARAIRFGTGGWRGVLGEAFDFGRLRALTAAVAELALREAPGAPVLVGHDTRFLADRAADCAARVLAGAGVRPLRAAGPVPTPVACHAVRRLGCAAGIVVTASHNPPEYLGVKVLGPAGASASERVTRALEQEAARRLRLGPPAEGSEAGRRLDLVGPYCRALAHLLDAGALRRSRVHVVYDAMHGAGAGVLDRVLEAVGVPVTRLRVAPDPRFGGGVPDPTAPRLGALARAVRAARGLRLGVATDGDADRFAAVDAGGRVLSETEALALLVDHLAASGRVRGPLAVSCATGSLVERVAGAHGVRVARRGIGFAPLTAALVAGDAAVAGEESGGFALAPFAREKDGMLAGALLAERVALTGESLGAGLRRLVRRYGASACGRAALPLEAPARRGLERLRTSPPSRLGGVRVAGVELAHGVRVALADGGFVLWRASGTEPVVRLYAEARDGAALRARLRAAAALLARAGR
jgi:phosphomannomutase